MEFTSLPRRECRNRYCVRPEHSRDESHITDEGVPYEGRKPPTERQT